jgi:hypothetical protein
MITYVFSRTRLYSYATMFETAYYRSSGYTLIVPGTSRTFLGRFLLIKFSKVMHSAAVESYLIIYGVIRTVIQ